MTVDPHITPPPAATLDQLRIALARDFATLAEQVSNASTSGDLVPPAPSGSALDTLVSLFQLNPVERAILGLAAGGDLDPDLMAALTTATGTPHADVSLAVSLYGPEAWTALCPASPLRWARLVDVTGTGPMLKRQLSVDERVLQFLMGLNYLDARLAGFVQQITPPDGHLPAAAAHITAAWSRPGPVPVLVLAGPDPMAIRAAFGRAVHDLGLTAFRVMSADIPTDQIQRHALAGYLDRELALSGGAVLIECNDHMDPALRLVDALNGPTAIAGPDPAMPDRSPRLRIDIAGPTPQERRNLWHSAMGPQAEALGADINRLAEQFALDHAGVLAASAACKTDMLITPDKIHEQAWQAAREQGRQQLDGLAHRIDTTAEWADLVLPATQHAMLKDMANHVHEAWRISEEWGWRAKSPRGLGTAALFAGPSGTGKTFAAEVLANRLRLDLYRIDLSQIVSKYIGETEKNLSRIFNAAEHGGAILLFDEADALFGKRSEVKDSHDRYANVEVSYLLQKMEEYRGLAILTTNQKSALDTAFLRRLRCVIQFPFPDASARAEIWARIFPADTPLAQLDLGRLARMNLSGGSIRSIALNASYLAAAQGGQVELVHILTAAQREYAKMEKPFTAAELGALS